MIVWGHGRRLQTLGSVGRQECPKCGQVANIFLGVLKKQFTLYWIPVIRWDGDYYLVCGICNASALIDKSLGARMRDELEGRTVPGGGQSLPPRSGPDHGQTAGGTSTPSRPIETFYDILGVAREATADEIRRSYHIRAQLVHPDHHAGASDEVVEEARRQMRLLNEAWEVLRDTDRRAAYDAVLSRRSAQQAQPRPERTREKPTTPRPSPTSRSEAHHGSKPEEPVKPRASRVDDHHLTEPSIAEDLGWLVAVAMVVALVVIGVAIAHHKSTSAATQAAATQAAATPAAATSWNPPSGYGFVFSGPDFAYVYLPLAESHCVARACWGFEVDSRYGCPQGISASVFTVPYGDVSGSLSSSVLPNEPVMVVVYPPHPVEGSDAQFACR